MTLQLKNNKAILLRVRRIAGQTQALEDALRQQTDCNLVLQQLAAIRGAVNGLMVEVLDGYLRAHLPAESEDGTVPGVDMAQVSRVLHSYLK